MPTSNPYILSPCPLQAGLFSAVLTAFVVESYSKLQPDDTAEVIGRAVAAHLGTSSPISGASDFTASPADVSINTLWFASLIFSLSAALLGILVKQWLHAYASGVPGDSLEIGLLRQHRLDNLEKWRVPMVVATIPILLLASVILFLFGLLTLLWTLNPVVAAVSTFLTAVLLAFLAFTTVVPSFTPGCAYISPQSELSMVVKAALSHLWSLLRLKFITNLRSARSMALQVESD